MRAVLIGGLLTTAAGAPDGVSAGSRNKLSAVVDTLKDIQTSVENEGKTEAESYKKYEDWCAKQKSDTGDSIDATKLQLDTAKGTVTELEASVEHLTQVLADAGKEREEVKNAAAQATNVREKDEEKYSDDAELNMQSSGQINEAITIVGKVHGGAAFLQHQQEHKEPGESSYVLGIMKGLKDQLGKSKEKMDTTEEESVGRHTEFMGTQNERIDTISDEMTIKKTDLTEAKVSLVEAKRIVKKAEVQLQELTSLNSEVTRQCEAKAGWWKIRTEDRAQELEALKQAIEVLNSEVVPAAAPASFLQTAGVNQHRPFSFIQAKSKIAGGHNLALLGAAEAQILALSVSGRGGSRGPLDAAKEVVNKLIVVLQTEQTEETKLKDYCTGELDKKNGEKGDLDNQIERLGASIERQSSEIDLLGSEIEGIDQSLTDMQTSLNEAAEIRKTELGVHKSGTADRVLTVKVLTQAKAVLEQFYKSAEGAALLQASQAPALPTGSARKDVQSEGAIGMLEMLMTELSKEQKDADMQENEAAGSFQNMQADCRKEFDKQMDAITARTKLKAKTTVHLNSDKEEKTQTTEDRASVADQLTGLHTQCDELLSNHDERLKARSFEVSQMKDVIEILSGSSIAARTGLVETSSMALSTSDAAASMDARELSLLGDMSRAAGSLASAVQN